MIGSFSYKAPKTEDELKELLNLSDNYRILAGGVRLMGRLFDMSPELLIDVKKIERFREVNFYPEKGLDIGAAVTMSEIAENDFINSDFELLADAAWKEGTSDERDRATIGGEICDRFSCLNNTLIGNALCCFDASVRLITDGIEKQLPISEFFNSFSDGDIVCSVNVPDKYCDFSGKCVKTGYHRISGAVLFNEDIMRIAVSHENESPVFIGEFFIADEFDYEKSIAGIFCEESDSLYIKKCLEELVVTAKGGKEKTSVTICVNGTEFYSEIPVSMSLFHFIKDVAGEAYDSNYSTCGFPVKIDGRNADSTKVLAVECDGCSIEL